MYNSATVTINGIKLVVTYDFEPAIKGGLEEEPQPAWLTAISATWNGLEIGDLISSLDAWGVVEDALIEQRMDAI